MKVKLGLQLVGMAAFLMGCSPRALETRPVVVDTEMGPVTCQLYTLEEVYWDRAIERPENMDVDAADDVCRAEGWRILRGGYPGELNE